ncbi:MAG: isochorismate synthase [Acidimicrobiia bacterium]|nr:isochorismate synthase [Acidimicrobiia bacterium]
MLIPRSALAEAAAALRAAPRSLRLASVAVDLEPLDLVRAGAGAFAAAGYFSSPEGVTLGGLGTAWTAVAAGTDRFAALDAAIEEGLPAGTEALVGFSFAPGGPASPEWEGFPGAAAWLPQITVVRREGATRLVFAVPPGGNPAAVLTAAATLRLPGEAAAPSAVASRAVPPLADWQAKVAAAAAAAGAGGPAKVVLSRSLRVALDRPADPFDLVALLQERSPAAYAYGWQAGPAALVGASPELLVSRSGERFACRPLAGSAPRGADPGSDHRLGEALLASRKERAEHAFVVEAVIAALRPLASSLEVPAGPVLDRLPGVQHLATPLGGVTGSRLLALAGALHPTPAVGGVPRDAALAAIAAAEGFDRGWYAGGVGWADASGDGEVALALRGALLRYDEAILYAGAGIVAGSEPGAEAAETDLKLAGMLGLFGG